MTKPNGSVATTVYDSKQRVISTVEKTASGNGFHVGVLVVHHIAHELMQEGLLQRGLDVRIQQDQAALASVLEHRPGAVL